METVIIYEPWSVSRELATAEDVPEVRWASGPGPSDGQRGRRGRRGPGVQTLGTRFCQTLAVTSNSDTAARATPARSPLRIPQATA
jgi:hypothetical protein